MTRSFASTPIESERLERLVELAARSPSAGKTQGWHVVVLEGDDTARYWNITLPTEQRTTFRWQHLLDAPVVMIVLADPSAYVARYAESDKARTGLGGGVDRWPAPYWTIDTAMAAMTLLLAAQDDGLGALFFGVFQREAEVRAEFAIPDSLEIVGAIALGHPRLDGAAEPGRSAARTRRSAADIIHRGAWRGRRE